MADDTNTNIPRPIGIKPITIKPMTPPPSTGEAPAPAAPAPAAPAPAAASAIKPIAIDPSAGGKPLGPVTTTATIRLKPVMPTQMSAPVGVRPDAPTAPMKPVRPQTIQPPTIKPSTQPTPEAAAKAKTARILLDAALNEIPSGGSIPAAPVGKITSKITSNLTADVAKAAKSQTSRVSLPQQAAVESGQPRTLRLKVPTPGETAPAESGESLAEAPTIKKKKSLVLKKDKMDAALVGASGPTITAGSESGESGNVSAFSAFQGPPPKKMNPVFPILAIASAFVIAALVVLYMSQACGPDRSLTGFVSFPGLPAPSWPGKVLTF